MREKMKNRDLELTLGRDMAFGDKTQNHVKSYKN